MLDLADNVNALLPLADEPALWASLRAGEQAARSRLIEAYLPFARMLAAKQYAGRIGDDLEFAEYLQSATVGLLEAVERYDPARGALFKAYAVLRIQGAMLNNLEQATEKRSQITTRQRLKAERRDSVKDALNDHDKDLFHQLADVAISLALGFMVDEADSYRHPDAMASPHYSSIELAQLRRSMKSLVDQLPERERLVIKYHYFNQMPI
ncbi:sigma-70 family RNA polymerase sigma factor, partial [Chitinimonas sp.]|uniref:sigma-70 family RNA polymerase sigma factor n=1 Tax=Chitinimonas sp. TaxID=1934313 RepID=UPI0035AE91EE